MVNIVTFEQKEKLEKLGFNPFAEDFRVSNNLYREPSVSEALQWLSEHKEIDNGVYPCKLSVSNGDIQVIGYLAKAFDLNNGDWKKLNVKNVKALDKPIAETALLDEILNYLEERK